MAVASSTRFYAVTWLGERAVADLRDSVFRHLTTLSPAFYERNHSAELMSRLTADTTQIKTAVSTSVSQALRNSVMLVGALIMMIATSAKLSALVILAIPVIILPLIGYGRVVRRLSRKAQDELASASAYAAENLAAPRTMQAFTFEDVVAARHAAAVDKSFEAARRRIGARAVLTATAIFLIFASIIGILWYGAHGVLAGTMSGGTLAQFVLYAAFAAGAVAELSEVWGEVQQAAGAARAPDGNQGDPTRTSRPSARVRSSQPSAARWRSRPSPSTTPAVRTLRSSPIYRSGSGPASASPSSDRRAQARARYSLCCSASMTSSPARSWSTACRWSRRI